MNKTAIVLAISLTAAPCVDAQTATTRAVGEWHSANQKAILSELTALLSIPNVASDAPNIARNAELLESMLRRRGFATSQLSVPGSPPAVFGEKNVEGAGETIVFYAHYDGQPVDPQEWASDPWTPVLLDGPREKGGQPIDLTGALSAIPSEARLYARSASDDKSPIVAFLSAIDALEAKKIPLRTNIKVFLEGEEENGSPHLEKMLRTHADKLKGDLWLFGDGPVHQSRAMQVYYGVRARRSSFDSVEAHEPPGEPVLFIVNDRVETSFPFGKSRQSR